MILGFIALVVVMALAYLPRLWVRGVIQRWSNAAIYPARAAHWRGAC